MIAVAWNGAYVYADGIKVLLIHRRGKFRNVMKTSPANCGKNFMLKPLEIIYNAFSSPENVKYAWLVHIMRR